MGKGVEGAGRMASRSKSTSSPWEEDFSCALAGAANERDFLSRRLRAAAGIGDAGGWWIEPASGASTVAEHTPCSTRLPLAAILAASAIASAGLAHSA